MCVRCPLVQNYSVITLDNWHLAYCCPTRSKDHKTVDCECWFIQQLASIAWLHSHLLFSYFRLIFVQSKSYKVVFREWRRSRSAMLIRTQTAFLGKIILIKLVQEYSA